MESVALPSLTPFLDGVDRWVELAPLLPVLVSLELVLSADNAVALAAIARAQKNVEFQRKALNIGILIALVLRVCLILTAQWVINFWPLQLIAGLYLLGLFIQKIRDLDESPNVDKSISLNQHEGNLWKTVIILAITDLAFSVDSVAAAVAVSDQFLLVITGAAIGVIALRFTSGLFIRWLDVYPRLEFAGYFAVAMIGLKLIIQLIIPSLNVPEWFILLTVALLFIWGFSIRSSSIQEN